MALTLKKVSSLIGEVVPYRHKYLYTGLNTCAMRERGEGGREGGVGRERERARALLSGLAEGERFLIVARIKEAFLMS